MEYRISNDKSREKYTYDYSVILKIQKQKDILLLPNKTKTYINKLYKEIAQHKENNKNVLKNQKWNRSSMKSTNASKKPVLFSKDNNQEYRGILNKVTNKNIRETGEKVKKLYENATNGDKAKMRDIYFDNIVSNIVFVDIYSELYVQLLKIDIDFTDTFEKRIDDYYDGFSQLVNYNCEEQYEEFCVQNEKRDRNRSFLKFITRSIIAIIETEEVELFTFYKKLFGTIVKRILTMFLDLINKENNKIKCDEIAEHLSIICQRNNLEMFISKMDTRENKHYIDDVLLCIDELKRIAELKPDPDTPSLSLRATFILGDIAKQLPNHSTFTIA
jgi:hypothetical protein